MKPKLASLIISVPEARRMLAGPFLTRRLLPEADDHTYWVTYSGLRQWRCWMWGVAMYLVTSLPFWLLVATIGEWAILSPLFLLYKGLSMITQSSSVAIAVIAMIMLLAITQRIVRHYRERTKPRLIKQMLEQGQMMAVAFSSGSEKWSEKTCLKACFANSIALQTRGIFPVFTLVTAAATTRLFMALYRSRFEKTGSRDEALSFIASVYLLRTVVGFLALATAAVAAAVTH